MKLLFLSLILLILILNRVIMFWYLDKKKRKKSARQSAKDLGIEIDEEAGQERIDMLTGKRMGDE